MNECPLRKKFREKFWLMKENVQNQFSDQLPFKGFRNHLLTIFLRMNPLPHLTFLCTY